MSKSSKIKQPLNRILFKLSRSTLKKYKLNCTPQPSTGKQSNTLP